MAFRTGGVAGMFTVGLGLLGATLIIIIFQNTSSAILIGFGFGGSLLALFLRVGGGIFTKAADVGADLVGKVEAGIPEDDPRNPATIADNVGDNVGDCAGMAADLFESYEVTLVASIILGVAAFNSIGANPALGLIFPLAARAIGVVASIAGVFAVKARPGETNALKPDQQGLPRRRLADPDRHAARRPRSTSATTSTTRGGGASAPSPSAWSWPSSSAGSPSTTPAPSTAGAGDRRGVRDRPGHRRAGRHVERHGELGLRRHRHRHRHRRRPSPSAAATCTFSLYLVALTGMGMLATTGVIVSEDTFGPVSDNAAGIAEMSGEFHGEPERIMVSLDAVGNTTKAVTKGFAIGSAVIAAVALFASFIETAGAELGLVAENLNDGVLRLPELAINVAEPKIFIGLLIGGAVPFLFSALAIRAVGRTAGVVVQEVRSQFADGQIMAGTKQPDYGPVIDICTAASLRELATPALLAVLTPVIIGFGIGWQALGGFLAAVILVGQLMANYLSNAGGAWDNAKKYIEDGNHGGKGSEAHKAAVIGDTVGDPFKDTAGPALNPLIKVMNLVSLLMLPAIINRSRRRRRPLRFVVAGDRPARARRCRHLVVARSRPACWRRTRRTSTAPISVEDLMLSGLSEWVTDVIDSLGYVGVALLVALENLFPPIPSEIVLPFAGFVARDGGATLPGMIVAATIGSLVGAWVLYGIGGWIGPEPAGPFLVRYGKWLRITQRRRRPGRAWFDRRAVVAVLVGRCIPLIRSLVSIPAGFRRMPFATFTLYTVIGSLIWNTALIGAGYILRDNWDDVEPVLDVVQNVVIVLIVVGVDLVRVDAEAERTGVTASMSLHAHRDASTSSATTRTTRAGCACRWRSTWCRRSRGDAVAGDTCVG